MTALRSSRSLLEAPPGTPAPSRAVADAVIVPEVDAGSTSVTRWNLALTLDEWRNAESAARSGQILSEYAQLWGALSLRLVTEDDVMSAIAAARRLDIVTAREIGSLQPDPAAYNQFPIAELRAAKLLPYSRRGDSVMVILTDPTLPNAARVLRTLDASGDVKLRLAKPSLLEPILARLDARRSSDFGSVSAEVTGIRPRRSVSSSRLQFGITEGEDEADKSQIERLVDEYLELALSSGASDVHFDPGPDGLTIAMRIDGRVRDIQRITPKTASLEPPEVEKVTRAILRRIFVMTKKQYDLAGNAPIDGAFSWQRPGTREKIDIRFVGFATTWGRDLVAISLRFLGVSRGDETLDNRGFEATVRRKIGQAVASREGVILTTGPTGSGKSTTMHAVLRSAYTPDMKVICIEDPVERKVPAYRQLEVQPQNPEASYPRLLRSTMRMDPDIILVGEVRDEESAEVTVQAANTGHLVCTTVHANSALMALKRLESLGVSPFLLATTTRLLMAQRLVRRLCRHCMASTESGDREHVTAILREHGYEKTIQWSDFGLTAEDLREGLDVMSALDRRSPYENPPAPDSMILDFEGLMHPRGCSKCGGSGYDGRVGVFEVVPISRELKLSIIDGQSIDDWEKIAYRQGARTLFANGLLKVLRGDTGLGTVVGALGHGYEPTSPL
jgi:type II secretory ATPase GspE/PulE/Tfp pilus assembly ATPase PilB-like protein